MGQLIWVHCPKSLSWSSLQGAGEEAHEQRQWGRVATAEEVAEAKGCQCQLTSIRSPSTSCGPSSTQHRPPTPQP